MRLSVRVAVGDRLKHTDPPLFRSLLRAIAAPVEAKGPPASILFQWRFGFDIRAAIACHGRLGLVDRSAILIDLCRAPEWSMSELAIRARHQRSPGHRSVSENSFKQSIFELKTGNCHGLVRKADLGPS
jgi:hypothetical protein